MLITRQPKEKPLRTKRGHRKPSFLTELGDGRAGSTFIPQGPVTMSPSSDAFSHTHPDPNPLPSAPIRRQTSNSNGLHNSSPAPKRPRNAFDFYCSREKDKLLAERGGDGVEKAREARVVDRLANGAGNLLADVPVDG